ncbi:hypothetical protein STRAU_7742 [Streptomyces aurantiacus JA 4570]|uniref:DUF5937 domain-containing protein n=1 Tax=Streptomyces aurantiacus JA 4570 TaxID=1286094 RepID=S3Z7S6_9ACTN|nr:DUF5937 family protein [Streptomyces aurantiacus]EPH39198.1 hypothetical protein STRAU_7742 [Streptomyces aurantiacus JA 4570]
MISAQLDAVSLSRVRLALSPAYEAVWWLRIAASGRRHPLFGDPGAGARWALRHPDVALVAGAVPNAALPGYMPDLLTPKPAAGRSARTLAEQLEAVGATPPEVAADQLAMVHSGRGPACAAVRSAIESGSFAPRAASGLRRFWQEALADGWPTLRAALEADVADRSADMAAHGVGHLLASLHPDVTWAGTSLRVHKDGYDESTPLSGAELVLAPSAAHWPHVGTQLCDPGNAVLCYPAAGLGAALDRRREPAVGRLLGRSRAALLGDLAAPRTTGELAARHRLPPPLHDALAPATVSYHLGVLHRGGLVLRKRDRHVVRYWRSAEGDALIGA